MTHFFKSNESNIILINKLMDLSIIHQAFAVQALDEMSKEVIKEEENLRNSSDNYIISIDAWIECAKDFQKALRKRRGQPSETIPYYNVYQTDFEVPKNLGTISITRQYETHSSIIDMLDHAGYDIVEDINQDKIMLSAERGAEEFFVKFEYEDEEGESNTGTLRFEKTNIF